MYDDKNELHHEHLLETSVTNPQPSEATQIKNARDELSELSEPNNERQTSRDWSSIQKHVQRVAEQKPAYFKSEYLQAMGEDHTDEWWESYLKEHKRVYLFGEEQCIAGSQIAIGKEQYTVIRSMDSGASNVILVEGSNGQKRILKRLTPDKVIDTFLAAKELEESDVPAYGNPKIFALDNPWVDTIAYDYIEGITCGEYVENAATEDERKSRREKVLHFFDSYITDMAKGRVLKNSRAFIPYDFNGGTLICKNPDDENLQFGIIDLVGEVSNKPIDDEEIERQRNALISDLDLP